MPTKKPPAEVRVKPIGLVLTVEEHKVIRCAAADCNLPMAVFCRFAALDRAEEIRKKEEKSAKTA